MMGEALPTGRVAECCGTDSESCATPTLVTDSTEADLSGLVIAGRQAGRQVRGIMFHDLKHDNTQNSSTARGMLHFVTSSSHHQELTIKSKTKLTTLVGTNSRPRKSKVPTLQSKVPTHSLIMYYSNTKMSILCSSRIIEV